MLGIVILVSEVYSRHVDQQVTVRAHINEIRKLVCRTNTWNLLLHLSSSPDVSQSNKYRKGRNDGFRSPLGQVTAVPCMY